MTTTDEHIKEIVRESVSLAVKDTLISLGLDTQDKINTQQQMMAMRNLSKLLADAEFQSDLVHLRKWRKSMEQASSIGMKTAVTILVTGFLSMMYLSITSFIKGVH